MRRFWRQICGPLNSIWEQPYQFAVWWIVAVVFGLAGFLVPMFLGLILNRITSEVFLAAVRAGSLASFSVVVLAEGIAGALVAQGTGSNVVAAGIRGLVSVLALLVAGIQVVFLVVQGMTTNGSTRAPILQVAVTLLAILFASYLYCFRFASWERDVAAVREADDHAVAELANSAQKVTADDAGVRL